MNPRQHRAAERIRELISEGQRVAALEKPSSVGAYIQGNDKIPLNAWRVNVDNIIHATFGANSPHYRHISVPLNGHMERSHEVLQVVGLLTGALSDLEGGHLIEQEFIIAGDIFDSVLEEAKHLANKEFKDPAAVLCRVVVEGALRRLAQQEGIPVTSTASALNDSLREGGRYAKPQWRVIQFWLDIGNAAAHGKFTEYSREDVLKIIADIERFLAQELHS